MIRIHKIYDMVCRLMIKMTTWPVLCTGMEDKLIWLGLRYRRYQ